MAAKFLSYNDNEYGIKSWFYQKNYFFHYFHTIFDEEFKNHSLKSPRQRFEDLLRKLTAKVKFVALRICSARQQIRELESAFIFFMHE